MRKKHPILFWGIIAFFCLCMLAAITVWLNLYTPVEPEDMREAVLVVDESIQLPEDFDDITWEEAIRVVQTPKEANSCLGYIIRNSADDNGFNRTYSFRQIYEGAPTNCTEETIVMAALLSDNGYPAYALCIQDPWKWRGHLEFIYKKDGFFYTRSGKPYKTIDEYIDKAMPGTFVNYMVIDLNAEYGDDWMSGSRNYLSLLGVIQTCLQTH